VIGLIGELSLCGATLAGGAASLMGLLGWRLHDGAWIGRARVALGLNLAFLMTAGAALAWALLKSDFRYAYVFAHTERSLGALYKLSAFWSGQEGSILLWALIFAALTCVRTALVPGRRSDALALCVLSAVLTFFNGLLLFGASPFTQLPGVVPAEGAGLNPMLHHWAMALHPPTLFVGYAAFAIPMAIMIGGVAGREDDWIEQMRPWALLAWMALTLGIALGAWWAYVELGWGGYWAWDPVENASLVPWLTGTALLHAIVAHRKTGGLGTWAAWLALATFALCLLATSLTRSGFVESVHAFAQSGIGVAFLGLMGIVIAIGACTIVAQQDARRAQPGAATLLGDLIHLALVLLVAMAAATLVGTIMPILSSLIFKSPMSVGSGYYARAVVPLGVVLAAIMAVAPLAVDAARNGRTVRTRLFIPTGAALAACMTSAALGYGHPEFLACVAIASFTLAGIVLSVWLNPHTWARRCGAWLAHAGLVLVMLGVAGSNLFSLRETVQLDADGSARVGGYVLKFEGLSDLRGEGYSAVQADVLLIAADGSTSTLHPQQRFYDRFAESNSEVSVRSGLGEDIYVALLGWHTGGERISLLVLINPLTIWIWIGAGAMALGSAWAAVPSLAMRLTTAKTRKGITSDRGVDSPAARPATGGVR